MLNNIYQTIYRYPLISPFRPFHKIGGGYGQDALERVLREKYGKYRPSVVLAMCNQHGNWSAAAVVCAQYSDSLLRAPLTTFPGVDI
jgi:hypothetical protein